MNEEKSNNYDHNPNAIPAYQLNDPKRYFSYQNDPIYTSDQQQSPFNHHQYYQQQQQPAFSTDVKTGLTNLPTYQDLWATFAFIIHLIITIVIFSFCVDALRGPSNPDSKIPPIFRDQAPLAFGVCIAVSIFFAFIYMLLLYRFPRQMVIGSFIATITLWVIGGLILMSMGSFIAGIVFFLLAALETFIIFLWRHRIPFSALLLENTVSVIRKYPSVFLVATIELVVEMIYVIFIIATITAVYAKDFSNGLTTFLIIYLAFSIFWTSQVLTNILHVIISGLFATYYFVVGSGQNMTAKNPLLSSSRRALTYSFGSVAFGSLVIALIQTFRFIFNMFRDNNSFIGACADCIIGLLENLAQYFNYYAYTQIAIYGKPYIRAAKDTWRLLKTSGAEVIINDNLLGNVLGIMVLLSGILSGGLGYMFCAMGRPEQSSDLAFFVIGGAVIGIIVMSLVCEIIHSGYSSTIVCYCEDPMALQRSKPELYERFQAANQARSFNQNV